MDAYVFARIADRAFLNRLLELAAVGESPIRYAAVLTGDADAIAAGEVDGFEALDGLLDTYFRPDPPLLLSTAIGLCPPPPRECKMPRKKRCADPVEAFVRIWVEPGRADAVVADLLTLDGIEEAGAVAGDFDVLTVLCEPTLGDARSRLIDQVHRVPSIIRTSTSFVLRSEPAPAQG